MGAAVVSKAIRIENVASDGDSATNSNVVSNGSDGVAQKRKARRSRNYGERLDDKMDRFTAVLKKMDAPQRLLHSRRLEPEEK